MIKIKLNTCQKLVLEALILILFLGNTVLAQQQTQNNKIDELIKELAETNYYPTTERIEKTLIKIGLPAVPALVKALENKENRNSVIKVLGRIVPDAKMALPKLLELLDDKDPFIHWYLPDAISAISKADEEIKIVVPLLIDKLNDTNQDEYRRASIIKALGNIGPKAIDAADLLVKELNTLSSYQGQVSKAQEVAIRALAKINPKVAIPLLINLSANEKLTYYVSYGSIGTFANLRQAIKSTLEEIFQTNLNHQPILFELIEKLEDKTNPFRCGAIFTLSILGEEAKAAIPYLVEAANDKDTNVRSNAIFALGEIGTQPEIIIPIVIKALKDNEGDVRYSAASLLYSDKLPLTPHQIKTITPLLINTLKEDWKLQKLNAYNHHYLYAEVLSKIGFEVIPYLINSLKDEDKSFRTCIISILNRYDQKAEDAIPDLMEMLADENKEVQYRAAFAIVDISDTKAKMVLPIIIEALRDKQFFIGASYAVRKLGPTAKEAIPILIDKLKEENTNKCSQETDFAIETLGIMGAEANTAVPVLLDYMHTAYCTPTENKAAQALGKIAIEDETVIPILLNDLNKPNNRGVSQALAEVGKVKSKTIVVKLIKALKSEDSHVRINAANALKIMGETAVDAIPALLESLKDEDSWVKFNAIDALGAMKEKAQVAIPSAGSK